MFNKAIGKVAKFSLWLAFVLIVVAIAAHFAEHPQSPFLPSTEISIQGAIVPLILAYSIGVGIVSSRRSPKNALDLFTTAFIFRIIISLLLTYAYQQQDEQILHEKATDILYLSFTDVLGDGYVAVVSLLYLAFSPNLLLPKIFNSTLGSLMPFFIYDITYKIYPDIKSASRALNFCIFLPPLLFYSAMNLKELPCAFLLTLTLWGLLVPSWMLGTRLSFALVCVGITAFIRGGWALLPLIAVGSYLIFGQGEWKISQFFSWRRILVMAVVGGVVFLGMGPFLNTAIEHINNRIFIGATASWGTLQTADSSVTRSFLDLDQPWSLRNILIQVSRAPFSPSPLVFFGEFNFSTLVIGLIGLTQYLMMPFFLRGIFCFWKNSEFCVVALVEIAMQVTIGLSLMLGLTIHRQSIPHFALLYILSSLGQETSQKYNFIIKGWWIAAMAYSVIYIVTKF